MFAEAAVYYNGRATSTLEIGNYLIIQKPDASISIHGAAFSKPLNYQNGASEITTITAGQELDDLGNNLFTSVPLQIIKATNKSNSKSEELFIAIYKIHSCQYHENWSDNKIKLTKSEKDLVKQIFADIYTYMPGIEVKLIELEHQTPYGNIDILVVDSNDIRHIIEVKRKTISIAGCGQLTRYVTHFRDLGYEVQPYVAAPAISKGALNYCTNHKQTFLKIQFEES